MELKIKKGRWSIFSPVPIYWNCCGRSVLQRSDRHLLFYFHRYILYGFFLEVSIISVLASATRISRTDIDLAFGSGLLPV